MSKQFNPGEVVPYDFPAIGAGMAVPEVAPVLGFCNRRWVPGEGPSRPTFERCSYPKGHDGKCAWGV